MAYFQLLFVTLALIMSLGFFVYVINSFYIFIKTGVSSKASRSSDILLLMDAYNLDDESVFYDLGSGDGRVALHATIKTGCRSVGYEVSLLKYLFSKIAAILFGVSGKTTFYWKRLEKADLTDADAVFCSLSPRLMKRLKKKFERELKDDVHIISEEYPIPHIAANNILKTDGIKKKRYYSYIYKNDTF